MNNEHSLVTRMLSFDKNAVFDGYPTITETDVNLICERSIDMLTRLAVVFSCHRILSFMGFSTLKTFAYFF